MSNMLRRMLLGSAILISIMVQTNKPGYGPYNKVGEQTQIVARQGRQQKVVRSLKRLKQAFEERLNGKLNDETAYPPGWEALRSLGSEIRSAICTGEDLLGIYQTIQGFDLRRLKHDWKGARDGAGKHLPVFPVEEVRFFAGSAADKRVLDGNLRTGILFIVMNDAPIFLYQSDQLYRKTIGRYAEFAQISEHFDSIDPEKPSQKFALELTLRMLEYKNEMFMRINEDLHFWAASVAGQKGTGVDNRVTGEFLEMVRGYFRRYRACGNAAPSQIP